MGQPLSINEQAALFASWDAQRAAADAKAQLAAMEPKPWSVYTIVVDGKLRIGTAERATHLFKSKQIAEMLAAQVQMFANMAAATAPMPDLEIKLNQLLKQQSVKSYDSLASMIETVYLNEEHVPLNAHGLRCITTSNHARWECFSLNEVARSSPLVRMPRAEIIERMRCAYIAGYTMLTDTKEGSFENINSPINFVFSSEEDMTAYKKMLQTQFPRAINGIEHVYKPDDNCYGWDIL